MRANFTLTKVIYVVTWCQSRAQNLWNTTQTNGFALVCKLVEKICVYMINKLGHMCLPEMKLLLLITREERGVKQMITGSHKWGGGKKQNADEYHISSSQFFISL